MTAITPAIAVGAWGGGGGGEEAADALGCWLRNYADQVWLFTREPAVDWTNNTSERGGCGGQTAPGRLRVLAHPDDARPLVPDPQLPRLGRRLTA